MSEYRVIGYSVLVIWLERNEAFEAEFTYHINYILLLLES